MHAALWLVKFRCKVALLGISNTGLALAALLLSAHGGGEQSRQKRWQAVRPPLHPTWRSLHTAWTFRAGIVESDEAIFDIQLQGHRLVYIGGGEVGCVEK